MAKATRKYFRENFVGTKTVNIYPSKSFPVYNNLVDEFLKWAINMYNRWSRGVVGATPEGMGHHILLSVKINML